MLQHFFLRSTFRFAPGMRVIEGHVHLGMAHDRLNQSGIFLRVHKERRQRMPPEVVEGVAVKLRVPELAVTLSVVLLTGVVVPAFADRVTPPVCVQAQLGSPAWARHWAFDKMPRFSAGQRAKAPWKAAGISLRLASSELSSWRRVSGRPAADAR